MKEDRSLRPGRETLIPLAEALAASHWVQLPDWYGVEYTSWFVKYAFYKLQKKGIIKTKWDFNCLYVETSADLGITLEISTQAMHNWFTGKSRPSLFSMAIICVMADIPFIFVRGPKRIKQATIEMAS